MKEASLEFCLRAQAEIDKADASDTLASNHDGHDGVSGLQHQRVFAYAECDIISPHNEPDVKDCMLFENGFCGTSIDTSMLNYTPLPLNSFVDRSLCAEAKMMAAFCDQLKQKGLAGGSSLNERLLGRLQVYTSQAPCLSCVGVLWQFHLHFPSMELCFSNGRRRRLQSFTFE